MIKQVILDRASRKKDKSVSMTFITELEQSSSEFMEIDTNLDQHGVIYFKTNGNLTQEEKDEIDKVDVHAEGKTKSQRLRSVLYVFHEQSDSNQTFKEFYSSKMEEIIEHYKNKLV